MSADLPSGAEETEALIQFLYLAPIGLVQARMDGEILMINPLCAQLLMPLSPDGDLSNLFDTLQGLAPDLALRARSFKPPHGKICDALQLQVSAGVPGGKPAQVLSLSLLKLDDVRLMAVLDDISLAVERERELRHSQAWIQCIVNSITDYALLSIDSSGLVQDWNPGVAQLTGYTAEATRGRSYALFHAAGTLLPWRAFDRLREADQSGWSLEEGWMQRADGQLFWGSSLIAPMHVPDDDASTPRSPSVPDDERSYSLIIRDISDRREAHEALRRSVSCDHLTGLANRRAFFESGAVEFERCARAGQALSLVVIDADHFKSINDRHGHAAGDAVLRHLAAALSAAFRASDVVARLGGEEFVVLLPGSTLDDAHSVADRLCRQAAAQAVTVAGVPIGCTVSAGVATLEGDVTSLDILLQRADAAMYAAKASGRNRVERWRADATAAARTA